MTGEARAGGARGRAAAARRAVGRRPSRRSRPTGATSTPSSSSTRPTTSSVRRCCSRPSTRPAYGGKPGAPLPRRAPVRLRRLARDGAPLPRAARRGGHHRPSSGSSASCPTRTRSRRRDRSGTSRARRSRWPTRPPGSWSSPAGRWSRRTARRSARSTRSLGDTMPTSSTGSPSRRALLGKPKYVPSELVASIDTDAVRLTIGKARGWSGSRSTRRPRWTLPRFVRAAERGNRLPACCARLLWTAIYGLLAALATWPPQRVATQLYRVVTGEQPPVKK